MLMLIKVIKDNKIMVKAKHEEKTPERLSKSKFLKEYELGEKIETYSLCGGLSADGRLVVGAYVKGHGEAFAKPGSSPAHVVTAVEENLTAVAENLTEGENLADVAELNDATPTRDDDDALEPCNVFPVAVASISIKAGASH